MADWSELFERRLQSVLRDSKAEETENIAGSLRGDFELTPPPTHHKVAAVRRQVARDPTSAFFETIRKKSRGGSSYNEAGDQATRYCNDDDNGATAVMTPAAQVIGVSTLADDNDTDRPIKGLQESYSNRARDLHGEAMKRLSDVQTALETELADMALQEDAFLTMVAEKQAQFSRPAEEWRVKIQTRAKGKKGDGADARLMTMATTTEKEERIVDRIATIRAAADALESDLDRLWKEWSQAQEEAARLLQTLLGDGGSPEADGLAVGGGDDIDQILAKAESELNAAAAEAIKEMKENEKTFKKLILAEECKLAQMMLSRQSKYD